MARRRRGYRRGYPVAVLIGFDRDRAVFWRVFSQVVKSHSPIEAPRGGKRERYNFHEAVVNALRPILKEGGRKRRRGGSREDRLREGISRPCRQASAVDEEGRRVRHIHGDRGLSHNSG